MINLIKRMIINHRRLRTPVCKTCANYTVQFFQPACTWAKYLEHYNRLNCASVEYAIFCLSTRRPYRSIQRSARQADRQTQGQALSRQ